MSKKQSTRKSEKAIIRQPSLPALIQKAQKTFNAHIRNRDKEHGCICCGSFNTSDAAHYFSAGNFSALRFSEMNVNLCCAKCNRFLAGNLIYYRMGLVKKYGEGNVRLLENSATINRVKKWSRFELELIIKEYGRTS